MTYNQLVQRMKNLKTKRNQKNQMVQVIGFEIIIRTIGKEQNGNKETEDQW